MVCVIVEDCFEQVENCFVLVFLVVQRMRQFMKGEEVFFEFGGDNKEVVIVF